MGDMKVADEAMGNEPLKHLWKVEVMLSAVDEQEIYEKLIPRVLHIGAMEKLYKK